MLVKLSMSLGSSLCLHTQYRLATLFADYYTAILWQNNDFKFAQWIRGSMVFIVECDLFISGL